MNYADLIRNKKVVFVGASPILLKYNMADIIDNYDLVVRTNGSIDLLYQKKFNSKYGKRIDILYTNNQFYREMSPLPVERYKKQGVKYMCMKTCHINDFRKFNDVISAKTFKGVIKDVCNKIKSASMGSFIYTDILRQDPEEFCIMGVDFFASKRKVFVHNNYQEYFPGYLPDKIRKQGNRINAGKKEDGHNFIENAQYIWELYNKYKNFKIHTPSLKILKGIIKGEIDQK